MSQVGGVGGVGAGLYLGVSARDLQTVQKLGGETVPGVPGDSRADVVVVRWPDESSFLAAKNQLERSCVPFRAGTRPQDVVAQFHAFAGRQAESLPEYGAVKTARPPKGPEPHELTMGLLAREAAPGSPLAVALSKHPGSGDAKAAELLGDHAVVAELARMAANLSKGKDSSSFETIKERYGGCLSLFDRDTLSKMLAALTQNPAQTVMQPAVLDDHREKVTALKAALAAPSPHETPAKVVAAADPRLLPVVELLTARAGGRPPTSQELTTALSDETLAGALVKAYADAAARKGGDTERERAKVRIEALLRFAPTDALTAAENALRAEGNKHPQDTGAFGASQLVATLIPKGPDADTRLAANRSGDSSSPE